MEFGRMEGLRMEINGKMMKILDQIYSLGLPSIVVVLFEIRPNGK